MFKAKQTGINISGQVIYIKSEYSFDFKPARNIDITLMIGYLYLGIDSETMLAQQVWGYSPYTNWTEKGLTVPSYIVGELHLEEDIESGVSKRIVENGLWTTFYDLKSGWICVGDDSFNKDDTVVEIATNTLISLNDGRIKAIWLKPLVHEVSSD